jgi:hypothetical protein
LGNMTCHPESTQQGGKREQFRGNYNLHLRMM